MLPQIPGDIHAASLHELVSQTAGRRLDQSCMTPNRCDQNGDGCKLSQHFQYRRCRDRNVKAFSTALGRRLLKPRYRASPAHQIAQSFSSVKLLRRECFGEEKLDGTDMRSAGCQYVASPCTTTGRLTGIVTHKKSPKKTLGARSSSGCRMSNTAESHCTCFGGLRANSEQISLATKLQSINGMHEHATKCKKDV